MDVEHFNRSGETKLFFILARFTGARPIKCHRMLFATTGSQTTLASLCVHRARRHFSLCLFLSLSGPRCVSSCDRFITLQHGQQIRWKKSTRANTNTLRLTDRARNECGQSHDCLSTSGARTWVIFYARHLMNIFAKYLIHRIDL